MQTKGVRSWAAKVVAGLESLRRSDRLLLVLSLVIGALVGLVVVAFILITGRLAARMYPAGGSGWRRVLVPVAGSISTGYLLWRYFPFARGSGIPQTKFALFVNDGRIMMRTVVGKFFCCSASLASGIALGREGPSVQVGAGISSTIARNLGLDSRQVKALVPVGCAAALAAAFNTPIAAVLFSLEEIMGDLQSSVLGAVVLSSATSWMVLHLVLGDDPLFHVSGYQLVHPVEFAIYAVLGIVGGLGSVAFVKLLLWLRGWFMTWPKATVWWQPAIGGLLVGVMGYFVPEVMGVGYNNVDKVLNGDVVLKLVALFAVLKIIATAVCYASGNAGGIFGPALFIGAMMGASVGSVAHAWFPAYTAGPGAYALVGMGTAFAGIVRTPLTSVIMVFEDHARLQHHRAADDLEFDLLLHLLQATARTDLRRAGSPGWRSSADGAVPRYFGTHPGPAGHARAFRRALAGRRDRRSAREDQRRALRRVAGRRQGGSVGHGAQYGLGRSRVPRPSRT